MWVVNGELDEGVANRAGGKGVRRRRVIGASRC